jgi:hypothetical protein
MWTAVGLVCVGILIGFICGVAIMMFAWMGADGLAIKRRRIILQGKPYNVFPVFHDDEETGGTGRRTVHL